MQHYRLFIILVGIFIFQPISAQIYTSKDATQIQTLGISDQALFDQLMITIAGVGSNARMIQEQQSLKP